MGDIFLKPDTETLRTCSICNLQKPFSEFYSDGTDNYNKKRYRRDCKECYRIARLKSRHRKEATRKALVEAEARARGEAKKQNKGRRSKR